jgi:hypothetical protein
MGELLSIQESLALPQVIHGAVLQRIHSPGEKGARVASLPRQRGKRGGEEWGPDKRMAKKEKKGRGIPAGGRWQVGLVCWVAMGSGPRLSVEREG